MVNCTFNNNNYNNNNNSNNNSNNNNNNNNNTTVKNIRKKEYDMPQQINLLNKWTIPKIQPKVIYQMNTF